MLELRLKSDAKRLATLREAVVRECRSSGADEAHATLVARITAELCVRRGVRIELLVVVTPHSDVTTVMVRSFGTNAAGLCADQRAVLERTTTRWSTMANRDGRTIVAEIPRVAVTADAPAAAPAVGESGGADRAPSLVRG